MLNIVGDKNTCSDWLNQGTGNAYQIMSNVPIIKETADPSVGASTMAGDAKSPINVNPNGAFYNGPVAPTVGPYQPGSFGARMTILIHELAHKVLAPGMDNRPVIENSNANTQLVLQHCRMVIDQWSFILNK